MRVCIVPVLLFTVPVYYVRFSQKIDCFSTLAAVRAAVIATTAVRYSI